MKQLSNSELNSVNEFSDTLTRPAKTGLTFVSWNTEPFLRLILDELKEEGTIYHYLFIRHKGEKDLLVGKTDKDHFHAYAYLAKKVTVSSFLARFKEPDPTRPDDPLGAYYEPKDPQKKSRAEMYRAAGWILYGMHDEQMERAGRGEPHEIRYKRKEYRTDDKAWFDALWKHLNRPYGEVEELRRPPLDYLGKMVQEFEITPQECLRRRWASPVVFRSLCGIWKDAQFSLEKDMLAQHERLAREWQEDTEQAQQARDLRDRMREEMVKTRAEFAALEKEKAVLTARDGSTSNDYQTITDDSMLPS